MRPTGALHLGHYKGVLTNWVQLQAQYPCYFMIADWHAMTTQADKLPSIKENIYNVALDWLACGVDPNQATLYVQSHVPAIAEMHLFLSMHTPHKWVETDPTLKDLLVTLTEEVSYGLLGYPVLQTADILTPRGTLVPVGKDQLAHLEVSRDIARRINHRAGSPVLPEPKPLLTQTPALPGLDGRKMSKSYNNAILISDSEDATWAKLKTAITDATRIKKDDPGHPEACLGIYPLYQVFASTETTQQVASECQAGTRGCMACKKQAAELIMETLRPIRERREQWAQQPQAVHAMLKTGAEKAQAQGHATLTALRQAFNLY